MGKKAGYFNGATEIEIVGTIGRDNVLRQVRPDYLRIYNRDTAQVTISLYVAEVQVENIVLASKESWNNTMFFRTGRDERITAVLSGAITTNEPSFFVIWDTIRDL